MAHLRKRFIEPIFKRAMSQAPSVCLLGMRQVGKTTLLRHSVRTYITLDDEKTVSRMRSGEFGVLETPLTPVGLDECQKLPGLFDAIKLRIDARRQMGRFILTGSVRFLSKRDIKESLTGRTKILELLPLTLAEALELPQCDFIHALSRAKKITDLEKTLRVRRSVSPRFMENHLLCGGMPGICFKRDPRLRFDLFVVHLETLLSRDLPLIYASRIPITRLRELLKLVSLHEGEPVSHEDLARRVGVSPPTVKALLEAFQALFLIRKCGKDVYFLEDGGLAHHLIPNELRPRRQLIQAFFYRELLALLHYRYHRAIEIKPYRTRGGASVPFTLHSSEFDFHLAFTVDSDERASEKSLKSLHSYRKKHANVRMIALHEGVEMYEASNGIWCLPISAFF